MKEKNVYIVIGFMLFALFFGAANLIYPAFLASIQDKISLGPLLAFA